MVVVSEYVETLIINHKETLSSVFSRFILGKSEESVGKSVESPPVVDESEVNPRPNRTPKRNSSYNYAFLSNALRIYAQLIKKFKSSYRCSCCPHKDGCLYYIIQVKTIF